MTFKIPISVLVVIYSKDFQFLLIERQGFPNYWQSVTGSIEYGESLINCAQREVFEETGITVVEDKPCNLKDLHTFRDFEIFQQWRHRYAPEVTHNREHWFSLMVDINIPVKISPKEHRQYLWCDGESAIKKCFSWTNKEAIQLILEQNL